MGRLYVLFESSSGYALFKVKETEVVAEKDDAFQKSVVDFGRFSQIVDLVGFAPFRSREDALDNILSVSEGKMHEHLRTFLEMNLGQVKNKKKAKFSLGVAEEKLAASITEGLNIPCQRGEIVREVRAFFSLELPVFSLELPVWSLLNSIFFLSLEHWNSTF
jgi:nucleolar protein 56